MSPPTRFTIESEREADGRWIAEIPALPGVLAYGATREESIARAKALALRVLAERLEHGEATRPAAHAASKRPSSSPRPRPDVCGRRCCG